MKKELQKIYLIYYSLLIAQAQDLWQHHYQILLIIYLKGVIELNVSNVNVRHDDKKCEICGIKYKHCDCFFKY